MRDGAIWTQIKFETLLTVVDNSLLYCYINTYIAET